METKGKKRRIAKEYSLEEAITTLKENDIELLKEIIENQPEMISEKEGSGSSLFHYAVTKNNKEIIELLLNKGADIEAMNYLGATPLQIATHKANLDLIKFLVEKGVKLEVFDTNGSLLFDNNSKKGREVIKFLLDNCTPIISPISFISEDSFSRSRILLSKDIFSETAYERVREEWEKEQGKLSSQEMEFETMSEKDNDKLFEAVEDGNIELFESIIKRRKIKEIDRVVDESGNTLLHVAAEANDSKMLELLVDKYKGNINAKNKYDLSVLHSVASGIANKREDWGIMEWILQRKDLDTDVKTKGGLTVEGILTAKDGYLADYYEDLKEKFPQLQGKVEKGN